MSRIHLYRSAVLKTKQDAGKSVVNEMSQQVRIGAKRMAPRSPAHLSGSRKPKPGPRLSEGIFLTKARVTANEVARDVVSGNEYSMAVHEGARAHRIQSHRGKVLKFYWRKRQRTVTGFRRIRPTQASYFDHVWHPGNKKPVKFLTVPTRVAAAKNNFRYKSG